MKRRATVICERNGRVLLVARVRGRWAFPGGRQKAGEELVDTFVFIAKMSDDATPTPSSEIERCKWVKLEELRKVEASIPTKGIAEIFLKQAHGSSGRPLREAFDAMAA